MNITNRSEALQGVTDKAGRTFWIIPGATRDVDVPDHWLAKYSKRTLFAIEGVDQIRESQTLAQLNNSAADVTRYTSQILELEGKLEDAEAREKKGAEALTLSAGRVSELETQVTDLTAERDALASQLEETKARVATLEGAGSTETETEAVVVKYEARHKGAGSYSVFDSEGNEVVAKLTQDQANEFNGGTDETRAAYVKEATNG